MNRMIILFMAMFAATSCFGQTTETVSDRFHYKYEKPVQDIAQLQKDSEERQRTWQDEFDAMKAGLAEGDRVSDNVKLEVTTKVEQDGDGINLVVGVSYETVSVTEKADDYGLGKYTIEGSNACVFMCNFLKIKLDNELASYLNDGAKVDINLTGATDGTPIKSRITYSGEYGDFKERPVTLNGKPHDMTVTRESGITTNGQLAFLRTQGVEDYLKKNVEHLKNTDNTFNVFAVENTEKGGGYRRVSVEIVIHNAFNVEPKTE